MEGGPTLQIPSTEFTCFLSELTTSSKKKGAFHSPRKFKINQIVDLNPGIGTHVTEMGPEGSFLGFVSRVGNFDLTQEPYPDPQFSQFWSALSRHGS